MTYYPKRLDIYEQPYLQHLGDSGLMIEHVANASLELHFLPEYSHIKIEGSQVEFTIRLFLGMHIAAKDADRLSKYETCSTVSPNKDYIALFESTLSSAGISYRKEYFSDRRGISYERLIFSLRELIVECQRVIDCVNRGSQYSEMNTRLEKGLFIAISRYVTS